VIAVSTDLAIAAVKRETQTIPIVMAFSIDPVETGFVSSLARHSTRLSNVAAGMSGRRLALLREAVPGLSRVAFLWNPDLRGAVFEYRKMEEAARSMRVELQSIVQPWGTRPHPIHRDEPACPVADDIARKSRRILEASRCGQLRLEESPAVYDLSYMISSFAARSSSLDRFAMRRRAHGADCLLPTFPSTSTSLNESDTVRAFFG
jgi:hypothetical protein